MTLMAIFYTLPQGNLTDFTMLEQMIAYFDTIPSSHRAAILAGGITFFWVIEGIVPLFKSEYRKWKHAKLNLIFTLTTVIIASICFAHMAILFNWYVVIGFSGGLFYPLDRTQD